MPKIRVMVTLKPALLDSAGQTVAGSLDKLGFHEVESARVGKVIELELNEFNSDRVKQMCDKLLANPVIEDYQFEAVS